MITPGIPYESYKVDEAFARYRAAIATPTTPTKPREDAIKRRRAVKDMQNQIANHLLTVEQLKGMTQREGAAKWKTSRETFCNARVEVRTPTKTDQAANNTDQAPTKCQITPTRRRPGGELDRPRPTITYCFDQAFCSASSR